MTVKHNRASTLQQSDERFSIDKDEYDFMLMDKVSGGIPFKKRHKEQEIVQMVENGTLSDFAFYLCFSL